MSKIFISVASYQDPLLWWTVKDCYKKAKHPENLVFGIVDQGTFPAYRHLEKTGFAQQIRYVFVPAIDARGVCWARHVAQTLYEGEDYFLQIDSHMWFEQDWDEYCIQLMQDSVENNPKRIYTGLSRGFEIVDGVPRPTFGGDDIAFQAVKRGVCLDKDNPHLWFDTIYVRSEFPVPAIHTHTGFIFTLGRFCHDIPYDPLLYFYGEEQNICVRAFTSGYDIYHPVKIPMRHFYIRKSSSKHWLQEEDALRSVPWWEREARSKQRLCDLLYLQKDLGIYGLGKERTLEDFARYSGIDYVHRLIAPTKNVPPWPDAT